MRLIALFTSCVLFSNEKIKYLNIPSCKNCIYFRPSLLQLDEMSFYAFGKCQKFGKKDIISGKISYSFADVCRKNEFKCGFNGNCFVEEKNARVRAIIFKMVVLSYTVIAVMLLLSGYYRIFMHH